MREWFLCKAKYMQEDDKGFSKLATKVYLLDAVNYTDAELRIHTELKYHINREFQVTNISKTNINEVFTYEDGMIWFKAKIQYMVMDGDSEKEKKITQYMVLPADDLRDAYDRLEEQLGKLMADSQIRSIADTLIEDVFPYIVEQEGEGEFTNNDPNNHNQSGKPLDNQPFDPFGEEEAPFEEEVNSYEQVQEEDEAKNEYKEEEAMEAQDKENTEEEGDNAEENEEEAEEAEEAEELE